MAALLRVELNTVKENMVHDLIKRHECAPKKLAIMKGDTHTVGRHVNHCGAKEGCRGSRDRKGCSGAL